MIKAVRATREELAAKYGLSERLIVRILALASRGLGTTGALLAEAPRVPAVADTLLSPELLEQARGLKSAALEALGPGGKHLAVVKGVLCLQEELQAEEEPVDTLPAAPREKNLGALEPSEM